MTSPRIRNWRINKRPKKEGRLLYKETTVVGNDQLTTTDCTKMRHNNAVTPSGVDCSVAAATVVSLDDGAPGKKRTDQAEKTTREASFLKTGNASEEDPSFCYFGRL